ncbi:MAG: ATP-dependent RecD-like DNA helicase [Candidatus Abyssobacteria bacterium SURF_5]|uniref:ATP-dependent RecD-like DNA helicase n=1 Tax=Abyssobacteria bacterium (strain SURF_5) TaxID=2093360 RepID=A0A3A4NRR2_ABYX5|nr:MAG: ATP-dependent RecD-like DNA helicase [Candidatus Abyssubacteria bacterium SURF_5]
MTTKENEISLRGTLEKIIYMNAEDGFTVALLNVSRKGGAVTIVGHLSGVREGEQLQALGSWETNQKFGEQFRVHSCQIIPPSTTEGIEKYLASGVIPGIGPVMAERIVHRFGMKTLHVMEESPQRLKEVPGIGRKTLKKILAAWEQHKDLRDTMIFLQSLGISAAYAGKIIKQYGGDASRIVRENPYRLTYDVYGIGFKQADAIAMHMGIAPDSPERAAAAVAHVLSGAAAEGHVFCPLHVVRERCQRLLAAPPAVIESGVAALVTERKVVIDRMNSQDAAYLVALYTAETGAADFLRSLRETLRLMPPIHAGKATTWFEKRHRMTLNARQREALAKAVSSKLLIITGGPGTGKTTIIQALVEIFRAKDQKVVLAAPTGRAAKKMEESAGATAMTIHRLLEYSPLFSGFLRDQANPIECDVLIIDEASMLDIVLLYHLLKAVPSEAGVILIGDIDQLPSVGPGNVLKDLIESHIAEVVRLTEIFRQEADSLIIANAHKVNRGEIPMMPRGEASPKSDFHFIERSNPDEVVATIENLVSQRIPNAFHLDPLLDIQVLSPMHRGPAGVANLNLRLQHLLNPSNHEIKHGARGFRLRDKVMQIRNNYEKEVFNGDIGLVSEIDPEAGQVGVDFDGRIVDYEQNELDDLELAYAISVHKSQGSEYRAVVMPMVNQHYMLLQRNLLYTAITRAKELVVLVGSIQALSQAVKNANVQYRNSGLASRLKSHSGG